jgi:hypothetical protein
MKWAVTFLFCKTSVKTMYGWFYIPDSIAILSHITHVFFKNGSNCGCWCVVCRKHASGQYCRRGMPHLQYYPDLDEPFGTNVKSCHDLMLSCHTLPTTIHTIMSAYNCVKFQFWYTSVIWPEAISLPNLNVSTQKIHTTYFVWNMPNRTARFRHLISIISAIQACGVES